MNNETKYRPVTAITMGDPAGMAGNCRRCNAGQRIT